MKAKSAYKTKSKPKPKKKPKAKRVGIRSKRRLLNVDIAYNLAERGNCISEIADIIDVSIQTIYNWMHKDSKLFDAIKRGNKIADARVEDSLYKRANGYEYDEVKNENMIIKGHKSKTFKQTITTKQIAADVTAQIFWLKNRKPDEWREKKDGEGGDTYYTNIINHIKQSGEIDEETRAAIRKERHDLREAINSGRPIPDDRGGTLKD